MKSVALVMLALMQPQPLTGDAFCNGVRALAAGAAEPVPFQAMGARQPRFQLGRLFCVLNATGYICLHNLSRPGETRHGYAAHMMTCLRNATRTTERRGFREQVIVRSGRLEARIAEHGMDRGHVGRSITIFFAAAS